MRYVRQGECSAEALQYMRQAKRSRIYAEIHASEPEQYSKNQPQFIEKLSVAGFQQASLPVQIRRKIEASEPYSKAESGSQTAHNKDVAGLSAIMPVVQMPTGLGTPQNANTPWKHF